MLEVKRYKKRGSDETTTPDPNEIVERLKNKSNVELVDKDLTHTHEEFRFYLDLFPYRQRSHTPVSSNSDIGYVEVVWNHGNDGPTDRIWIRPVKDDFETRDDRMPDTGCIPGHFFDTLNSLSEQYLDVFT